MSFTPYAVESTGCPVLANLVPGETVIIHGLTQGTLGTFSVIAQAVEADRLSTNVSVLATGAADPMSGIVNWGDCQLTMLTDNLGNTVAGEANISNFPWFKNGVTNNTVDASSTLSFAGFPGASGQMNNNHLVKSDLTINQGTGDVFTFNENFLKNAVIQLIGPGTSKVWGYLNNTVIDSIHYLQANNALNMNNNFTVNNASVDIECDNPVDISLVTMIGGAQLNLLSGGVGTLRVNSVLINNSTVNFSGTIGSILPFLDSTVADESLVNFDGTWNAALTLTFRYLSLRTQSTLHASGINTDTTFVHSEIIGNSTVNITGSTNSHAVYVEGQSTLTLNAFNLVNGRLQDANSTLVANLNNAIKSGYVNALP